jgi:hypothetical protein
MVMSVGFENLKFVGQFLCPALGDRSHQVLKELKVFLPSSRRGLLTGLLVGGQEDYSSAALFTTYTMPPVISGTLFSHILVIGETVMTVCS